VTETKNRPGVDVTGAALIATRDGTPVGYVPSMVAVTS